MVGRPDFLVSTGDDTGGGALAGSPDILNLEPRLLSVGVVVSGEDLPLELLVMLALLLIVAAAVRKGGRLGAPDLEPVEETEGVRAGGPLVGETRDARRVPVFAADDDDAAGGAVDVVGRAGGPIMLPRVPIVEDGRTGAIEDALPPTGVGVLEFGPDDIALETARGASLVGEATPPILGGPPGPGAAFGGGLKIALLFRP